MLLAGTSATLTQVTVMRRLGLFQYLIKANFQTRGNMYTL